MPMQYEYTEPEQVTCMKVVTPVVLADEEAQILIDKAVHLPELCKKVDHIDAWVMNLQTDPVFIHEHLGNWNMVIPKEWHGHFSHCVGGIAVVKKVIVSGVLHKQIYYVNKDDVVKHLQEEIHFSKMVELRRPQPVLDEDEVEIKFFKPRIDVEWDLIRGGRLQQTGVVIIRLKIVENRQIYVQTCPNPEEGPEGNLLEDPGLEQWAGNVPIFWGASNVGRTTIAHTGSYAAELGMVPSQQAALFQSVRIPIRAGMVHKLSFWAREDKFGNSDYTLTAQVRFFNRVGLPVGGASNNYPCSAISDTAYQQFMINIPEAPGNATTAVVEFLFQPNTGNASTVKIDDVDLAAVRFK